MAGISQSNSSALKNPWALGILAVLVLFLCGNAVFIYLAFKTAPSLVVKDFYEKGEAYEETHKRLQAEKSLGWVGVLMTPKTRVNQTNQFEVIIQGNNSSALSLDSVKLFAFRPSDADADFSLDMHKSPQPSTYAVDVSFPLPGIWDLIVEAKQGEDTFSVTKRISIQP
jgi:nitrogen fixation protein FixH